MADGQQVDPLSWAVNIWNFFASIGTFFLQLLGYKIAKDAIIPPKPETFLQNLIILVLTVLVGYALVKYLLKII